VGLAYLTPEAIIFGVFVAFVLAVTVYFLYAVRKVEELEEETTIEEEEYPIGRPKATSREATVELAKVKGIGPKLSEKLKNAGVNNVRELASSTPKRIAESLGISKERASRLIKNARSLLKK
jgi:predicted flap endonuclease-1-like 5' DNA nuclease